MARVLAGCASGSGFNSSTVFFSRGLVGSETNVNQVHLEKLCFLSSKLTISDFFYPRNLRTNWNKYKVCAKNNNDYF